MIFLANKPINISSNTYASKLGKKLGVKLGYSGTLDPFACGALLCADKKHAKLFRFLNLEPKVYEATIWLGASSPSLDNENISLTNVNELALEQIKVAFNKFQGDIKYTPPIFCAKKINGKRAYELARNGEEVVLSECVMSVKAELLHYNFPFISFRLSASKGTYVRSYAQLICDELGVVGTLSSLRRISEGEFKEFKKYDAYTSVDLEENEYLGDINDVLLGKKLSLNDFKYQEYKTYKIDLGECFSIIKLDEKIEYILNKVEKC
ncbi:tRNA pseudouridine 55 synthase [Campylobacter sp. RM5004]|uniref:tRNA pseudouridine(55) synthase TruB n=1 Tax=Campylobacter sp. RM5004 TaxID=1660078 RepID=UPI001EFAE7D3|nr:tRNA pseudouridine(55) synthase TruB [Campylobacter sp. RM5004]ULO02454.1 tRNA pseudouridine 55 synthase [Campylobacter sp. RM5004]